MKTYLGLTTFISYLCLATLAPVHMVEMAKMKTPMEHCPFSFSLHTFCNMSLIEHINSWNNFSKIIFTKTFKNFLSPISLSFIATLFAIFYLLGFEIFFKRQRLRKIFNKLENMYSTGILNPKIY